VREAGSARFGYEVQYLLEAGEEVIGPLRDALCALGDSVVVVGGDGLYSVHAHVNDVGAAVEAGIDAGRPSRVDVTRFADTPAEPAGTGTAGAVAEAPAPRGDEARAWPAGGTRVRRRAVVAVSDGAGLTALLRAEGAGVVPGGPAATADDLLAVVATAAAAGAREVVLLPNDPDLLDAAEWAAGAAQARHGVEVRIVPTRTAAEGLAALAVADGDRPFGDDVAAMADSAGGMRGGEVALAPYAADTAAGPVRRGDAVGLVDGAVEVVGRDPLAVAVEVADRLLAAAGGELLTVLAGVACPPSLADRLADEVGQAHPGVEVTIYAGGQPGVLLLGAE
jgi:dihydroxyacetone kinase-like predicted kinase